MRELELNLSEQQHFREVFQQTIWTFHRLP
jgi:hypothetical protein